jgi:hypothetical protein
MRTFLFTLTLIFLWTHAANCSFLGFPSGYFGRRWAFGGNFDTAYNPNGPNVKNLGNFAAWNGTDFLSYNGGVDGPVKVITVDTCRNVYIGGSFRNTTPETGETIFTGPLAMWLDGGSSWQEVGPFQSFTGTVNAITVDCFNIATILGGSCRCNVWFAGLFKLVLNNGQVAINVAKYDVKSNSFDTLGGNATQPTGSGILSNVPAYAIYKKDIPTFLDIETHIIHVAGDNFYYQYDESTNQWSNKTPAGTGPIEFRSIAYESEVFSTDRMFFGGSFSFQASGGLCNNLCGYDHKTNSWYVVTTSANSSANNAVSSLYISGNTLYVAGNFTNNGFEYLATVSTGTSSTFSSINQQSNVIQVPLSSVQACGLFDFACSKGSVTVAGFDGFLQFYDASSSSWTNFGNIAYPLTITEQAGGQVRIYSMYTWNYLGSSSTTKVFSLTWCLVLILTLLFQ